MPLCQGTFSWIGLEYMFMFTEFIQRWFVCCLNGTVGPFIPTTKEQQKRLELLLRKFFLTPFYFIGVLLLTVPAFIAFIFRCILHNFRNLYHLSVVVEERPWLLQKNQNASETNGDINYAAKHETDSFSFSTMNMCLLPELAAKFNNLDKTTERAKSAGERIIVDQFYYKNTSEMQQRIQNGCVSHLSNNVSSLKFTGKEHKDFGVVSHFSHLDFICIQETFDRDCAKLLVQELHKVFPWVVYDVGVCGIKANLYGLSSGLMVASRYEIVEIGFKRFDLKSGLDLFADKGMLMIKVSLDGCKEKSPHKVGYIFNTHLQAFQGDRPIVQNQLDNILEWTTEFRQKTSGQSELVMFDVLCADFNIDNLSPGESYLRNHELFSVYMDFARVMPGKDKEWTVGTELRIPTLQDEAISTPDNLKKALKDPYLRQQYVIDADVETATMSGMCNAVAKKDKHGNIILSPVGGKRRIDWILYRNDCNLEVKKYHFVTRLASLTDHIPVAMSINCKRQ